MDYDVSWMEEAGIEFMRGTVLASQDCLQATDGVDAVVHLAAETGTGQSMYEMRRYVETNVTGTAVLLEACAERQVAKIVLASSRAVYGEGMWRCPACGPVHPSPRTFDGAETGDWRADCPNCGNKVTDMLPTEDDAPLDPTSVYGTSKLAQELLIQGLARIQAIDASMLRLFNVYGPGQSLSNPYTGVLAVFATRARQGKTIDLYEDGEILRDFVFVEDVVDAFCAALEASNPPTCNIGSGRAVSIRYLAETIVATLGSSSTLTVTGRGRKGDVRGLEADITRARDILNWTPTTPLEEGLRRFLSWAMSESYEDGYERSLRELVERGLYK
jgi:dTDP-L-rhamnose 4-epimerase